MERTISVVSLAGLILFCSQISAVDILDLYGHGPMKRIMEAAKRVSGCPPIRPFSCPGGEQCLPLQYICDGSNDCPDGYDEDKRLCTAAIRPPVEETVNFLAHLIKINGPDFLIQIFGSKAKDALAPMGGVEAVAVALSESKSIEEFGKVLNLMGSDVDHLRTILEAIKQDDPTVLSAMGIKDSAVPDIKFFLEKLVKTGFIN